MAVVETGFTIIYLATDHSRSDHRIALQSMIVA